MPDHYTTDTISSPGWIRTSDLSHVTGMSCPLNDGTVQVPRPGFEPGTPRSKRGMIVRFTIGASSGRQGSRTLISVGRTALAERPGQPYPATFLSWTHRESNPDLQSAELVSSRWTMSPCSQGSGNRTHVLQLPRLADCRFPIPRKWTARELHPHFRRAKPVSSSWTSSPHSRGGNRTHRPSPGSRPGRFTDLRTRPTKLRRPDSNRRRTAYETVLETRLQSTPQ